MSVFDDPIADGRLWDLCIIGSGHVGMAMALECETLGQSVLLLESGKMHIDPELTDASRAEIVDMQRHAPMETSTCRALGGTSWTWGGRCVAYDDVDFEHRDYLPDTEWPLSHSDIKPWYAKAAQYLLCGSDRFEALPVAGLNFGADVDVHSLERWSTNPKLALVHRDKLVRSKLIHVYLNSTVVDLEVDDASNSITSAVVAAADGRISICAKKFIVAAGGVETTRLLLAVQRKHAGLFGGVNGPLGRYYMGHLSGKIANVVFNDPASVSAFDYELDSDGVYTRRRLTLTKEAQKANQVLNTAFWPDSPGSHERSAAQGTLVDYFDILRGRANIKPSRPGYLMMNKLGKYPLRYHAEQVPNPESRIRLWGQKDQFGMPRVTIDLRFTKPDVQSVIRSHQILDKALQDNGFGKLNYLYPQNALAAHVYKQASDGYHQYGTTRMGVDPKRSVVDAHLRVHDIKNLYIASSSVCPTAGQANPTLLGVALGVRLINEIIDEAKNTNHVHSQSNRFTRYIDPRVRPGHVLSRTA